MLSSVTSFNRPLFHRFTPATQSKILFSHANKPKLANSLDGSSKQEMINVALKLYAANKLSLGYINDVTNMVNRLNQVGSETLIQNLIMESGYTLMLSDYNGYIIGGFLTRPGLVGGTVAEARLHLDSKPYDCLAFFISYHQITSDGVANEIVNLLSLPENLV